MLELNYLSISKSNNTQYGVFKQGDDYVFTCAFDVKDSLILVISDVKDEIEIKIPIDEFKYYGKIYSLVVSGLNLKKFKYYYICDDVICMDPYAKKKCLKRTFGKPYSYTDEDSIIANNEAFFSTDDYDFENDKRPLINHSDVIAYELHVRGFTKHTSSKVKGKGCFLGIIEKIPYFLELNINQIELMPSYDFYEFDKTDVISEEGCEKLNYWGYKSGNYFCPKYEYSYSKDAVSEFKDMVKALHKAGIEIIMQMYFSSDTKHTLIIDCLRYWYTEYRVDGFHVIGPKIPSELIMNDDVLIEAKLLINNINKDDYDILSLYKSSNVIDVNDGFMVAMRRFLKGDSGSLNSFVYYNRLNSIDYRTINYITKYEGFTLNDLVSYERKHNEDNGENNNDGNDENFSWNCGIEGKSAKNSIVKLRTRQIKNALCLLFLAQGTPMLFMGDEFMNTQKGNNNPYCQDNYITWLNWKLNKTSEEILSFTKMLTSFRKNSKILHQNKELMNMDYIQCGNPDISYHQEMAWKSDLSNYHIHIGIMLEGQYSESGDEDTLYITYNMHWENHVFALPRLKDSLEWELVFTTATNEESEEIKADLLNSQDEICVFKRSVVVLRAKHRPLRRINK